jgi:hypothetical protein
MDPSANALRMSKSSVPWMTTAVWDNVRVSHREEEFLSKFLSERQGSMACHPRAFQQSAAESTVERNAFHVIRARISSHSCCVNSRRKATWWDWLSALSDG